MAPGRGCATKMWSGRRNLILEGLELRKQRPTGEANLAVVAASVRRKGCQPVLRTMYVRSEPSRFVGDLRALPILVAYPSASLRSGLAGAQCKL
jgi:hypothetical protein